ncbi:hypothetical protein HO924_00520 [Streptococcus suis]|nr:hypothetical protein [Streptococcus suis]
MIPKFRAWDKENKKMLVVNDICNLFWENTFFECYELVPDPKGKREYELINHRIDFEDCVLMQSTGLFSTFSEDELFEDDVIFWTYFDEFEDTGKARIVHRDGCWKLLDIKTGKEAWDSLFDCLENCTVFLSGNIYENPELLEVNK